MIHSIIGKKSTSICNDRHYVSTTRRRRRKVVEVGRREIRGLARVAEIRRAVDRWGGDAHVVFDRAKHRVVVIIIHIDDGAFDERREQDRADQAATVRCRNVVDLRVLVAA